MIRYDLLCDQDHAFDGWFRDSETFESLVKMQQVECTLCGSTDVHKALMAPSLGKKGNQKSEVKKPEVPKELMKAMREIRRVVSEKADYVGDQFAEEARKIHYKETEDRGIYGETTLDDAKSLQEEGIDIMPLPMLPEDQN